MQWAKDCFIIYDEKSKVNINAVKSLLKQSCWAPSRPKKVIETCIKHARCFSLFHKNRQTQEQVIILFFRILNYLQIAFNSLFQTMVERFNNYCMTD